MPSRSREALAALLASGRSASGAEVPLLPRAGSPSARPWDISTLEGERRTTWMALVATAVVSLLDAALLGADGAGWLDLRLEGLRGPTSLAALAFAGFLGLLAELHRRGSEWPVRILTLGLVVLVVPTIGADAFATTMPQAIWLPPLVAFALTSLRWSLFTTALTLGGVYVLYGSVGPFDTSAVVAMTGVILTFLVAGKRRHQDMLRAQQAQADAALQAAFFDPLTGLPNRRLLVDRLAEAVKHAAPGEERLAVLFLDLDHFKDVNDALGHIQGDALLLEVSRRIRAVVRPTDTLARFSADVFVIVLDGTGDRAEVSRVTDAVQQCFVAPFTAAGEPVPLTATIGVAMYPEDGNTGDELLLRAERALHDAKAAGRNRVGYYTSALQEAAERRLRLTRELRHAIDAGQLRLYYQPIIDLETGVIWKAEALVRWEHPTLGMVSPATFIPLAESSGLIHALGDWVFREAAAQVKAWRDVSGRDFQISVNRSPAQFASAGPVAGQASWAAHLKGLGLPGNAIAMEITEGLLLEDSKGVGDELDAVRSAGISVSLDDFGTGYSALAYLHRYPIDIVKLDRAFVRKLTPESRNLALCRGIIAMSHDLGMKVVAEGVESEIERDLLVAAGCDYAQGFLFGKPMPPEEFEARHIRPGPEPEAPRLPRSSAA